MKKFFEDITDTNMFLTVLLFLLLGMFTGVFFQSEYSVGVRTFFQKIYLKLNPDASKDSKTLILEKAGGSILELPTNNIFETKENENKLKSICKKLLKKQSDKNTCININNYN